jgi:hypothetical protein
LLTAGLDVLTVGSSDGYRKSFALWLLKPDDMIVPGLVLAAAWIAGDGARTRRAYTADLGTHKVLGGLTHEYYIAA